MTAQVIDFAEAKKKILGISTAEEPVAFTPDLSKALEAFSFSRLPKRERILRILLAVPPTVGANEEYLGSLADKIASLTLEDAFSSNT